MVWREVIPDAVINWKLRFRINDAFFANKITQQVFNMKNNQKIYINPLVPGVHLKVTHTETNLQLSDAVLFK